MRLPPVPRHLPVLVLACAGLLVAACGMPVGGGPVPDLGGSGAGGGNGGGGSNGGADGGRTADGGAWDGGGHFDGGAYDGGLYDGGLYDGGAYDGGVYDGGLYDGGPSDGGLSCRSDADCPPNDLCACAPCDTDGGACGACTVGTCVPAHNCGDIDCTADQICVVAEGGAVMPDGGGAVHYSCEAWPSACGSTATCGCLGRAFCGSASRSDCTGAIPVVTCYLP